jgi:hypothetical protein
MWTGSPRLGCGDVSLQCAPASLQAGTTTAMVMAHSAQAGPDRSTQTFIPVWCLLPPFHATYDQRMIRSTK